MRLTWLVISLLLCILLRVYKFLGTYEECSIAASQSVITEGISSTDSIGTHSDVSGHTTIPGRPKMDVACVLDLQQPEHLAQRKRALEEVRQACNLVNANMHHIQV